MAVPVAWAQVACPAIPPRAAPPAEAVPGLVPVPYWHQRMEVLGRTSATTDLPRVRLLFLGDSITEGWTPLIFQQFYGHRGALNMGVGSDTTQGLLWRLARSPLGTTLRPQLVVLMIGTNNTHNPKSDEVALGIAETIRLIRQRSPGSRILVVGIPPRGATALDPVRGSVARVNALVSRCADNTAVFYTDPGAMMVDHAGNLSNQVATDLLHPTVIGYAILSAALEPLIHSLLGKP
jgi:beta-glucosidase